MPFFQTRDRTYILLEKNEYINQLTGFNDKQQISTANGKGKYSFVSKDIDFRNRFSRGVLLWYASMQPLSLSYKPPPPHKNTTFGISAGSHYSSCTHATKKCFASICESLVLFPDVFISLRISNHMWLTHTHTHGQWPHPTYTKPKVTLVDCPLKELQSVKDSGQQTRSPMLQVFFDGTHFKLLRQLGRKNRHKYLHTLRPFSSGHKRMWHEIILFSSPLNLGSIWIQMTCIMIHCFRFRMMLIRCISRNCCTKYVAFTRE